ncbi:MAG: FecR domain-containing protein [Candidatus Contendobacter sp.]|nr:FecR domain-containing protein [Candidatus Contendobacter sp.]MDG4556653.1 FecR domain-containing protein [Candidatus Contendobacter sp.]
MRTVWRTTPGKAKLFLISGLLSSALLAMTAAHSEEWLYTVRPGDTLLGVSADYLIRTDYWSRLQTLNGVADPTRLPPGMKLRIPIPWLKRLPAKVQVLSTRGEVSAVIAATGQTVAVHPGQSLQTGDTLLTGPDGAAGLEFRDGSRVLLQAGSELRMDTLSAYGPTRFADTRVRLLQGRVESQVRPRTEAGSRYEISTPAATSAVRGTRYRIGMDPAEATARTEVLEGAVAFQGRQTTRTVKQGFGSLAETGQAPLPPVPLLPPPKLGERPPVVTRWPVQLRFFPLEGAAAYRAQLVPADPFKGLLLDTLLPALKSDGREATDALTLMLNPVGPALPDGEYIARIRGIDDKGLEGRDAQYRFRFHASPGQDFEEDENRYIYK